MKTNLKLNIKGHLMIMNQVGIIKYNEHNDINPAVSLKIVANRLVGGVFANNNGIIQLEYNHDANLTGLVAVSNYEVNNNELTITAQITDTEFSGVLNHLYLKTPTEETFSSRENINITKEEEEILFVTWKLTFNIN